MKRRDEETARSRLEHPQEGARHEQDEIAMATGSARAISVVQVFIVSCRLVLSVKFELYQGNERRILGQILKL